MLAGRRPRGAGGGCRTGDGVHRRGPRPPRPQWGGALGRVSVVHHGAPAELQAPTGGRDATAHLRTEVTALGADASRARPHGARVLSTFGLLSSVKGIEVALRAMARVASRTPTSSTWSPAVPTRTSSGPRGERVPGVPGALARALGLDQHVLFLDRYLTQRTSAASWAAPRCSSPRTAPGAGRLGRAHLRDRRAGCPVVSTPYRYATELLPTGAGRLVGVDDRTRWRRPCSSCSGTSRRSGRRRGRRTPSARSTRGPPSAGGAQAPGARRRGPRERRR